MKSRLFALIFLVLLLTFIVAGCGGKTPTDDTTPSTEKPESQNELFSSSADSSSEEGSVPYEHYTKDPDELEIMTIPGNTSDSENGSTDSPVQNTQGESSDRDATQSVTSAPTITEPTLPLNDGEKIELPFVPAE